MSSSGTAFLGMAYKGEGSNTLYTASYDGTWWYGNTPIKKQPGNIDPQSDQSPGVAMFQDELVLVYKEAGTNDLYVTNFDGTQWYGGNTINTEPGNTIPVTDVAPSLIVFNDTLFVVYKGAGSHSIYLAWTDGNTWSGPLAIEQMPG